MTGTPQKTIQVPLYKICCLIPHQINEQDIVYLSSGSDIHKFLEVHGISDKFIVDSGRSSTATCTEDLPALSETRKNLVTNNEEVKCKETYDRQMQFNWENVNNLTSYQCETIPWHRCSKNDCLVHICKKCNASFCEDLKDSVHSEGIKKNTKKSELNKIEVEARECVTLNDSKNFKKTNQKSKSDANKNKKASKYTNKSFIGILKKRLKNSHTTVTKPKNETTDTSVKSKDTFDDPIDGKISLLAESIICETSASENYDLREFAGTDQKNNKFKEINVGTTDVKLSNTTVGFSEIKSKSLDDDNDVLSNIDTKEVSNYSEWSDALSVQSSTFDCNAEEQDSKNGDLTFYESPTKFVEDISNSVMRRFIEEECDDSWLKQYENKRIPKRKLGIDKHLSELYILKKMANHGTSNCLILHLTHRQKRLLANGIVHALEEFNTNGSRWGGLSREILKDICKLFRTQQGIVP